VAAYSAGTPKVGIQSFLWDRIKPVIQIINISWKLFSTRWVLFGHLDAHMAKTLVDVLGYSGFSK